MKRFLVFAYYAYYPYGGWSDFKKSFESEKEAVEFADSIQQNYSGGCEVVDMEVEEDKYVYPKYRQQINKPTTESTTSSYTSPLWPGPLGGDD